MSKSFLGGGGGEHVYKNVKLGLVFHQIIMISAH